MKQCPVCRHFLKHKLGTNKWYCSNCRIWYYNTVNGVYYTRNSRGTSLKPVTTTAVAKIRQKKTPSFTSEEKLLLYKEMEV